MITVSFLQSDFYPLIYIATSLTDSQMVLYTSKCPAIQMYLCKYALYSHAYKCTNMYTSANIHV